MLPNAYSNRMRVNLRLGSFLLQDLKGTVHCVFVAVSLQTLQKGEGKKSVLLKLENLMIWRLNHYGI